MYCFYLEYMNYPQKKYRIFTFLPIFSLVLLILGIGGFSLFLLDLSENNKPYVFLILLLFLVLFPLVLFLWSFITMWPQLTFDEKGITKTLLGVKLKHINWQDIVDIKKFNNGLVKWIFLSKSTLHSNSITICRLRRDNVYIVENEEIVNIIKKNLPDTTKYDL